MARMVNQVNGSASWLELAAAEEVRENQPKHAVGSDLVSAATEGRYVTLDISLGRCKYSKYFSA